MEKKIGFNGFMGRLLHHMLASELLNVKWAYILSKIGHNYKAKRRRDGTRASDHPRMAAIIAIDELGIKEWMLIVTILLHDIREDSYLLDEELIILIFGRTVARWVKLLTKKNKKIYHKLLAECEIWQVLLVKLCDRLHNLRTLPPNDPVFIQKQIKETRKYFFDFADTLIALLPRKNKWRGEYLKEQIQKICDQYPT